MNAAVAPTQEALFTSLRAFIKTLIDAPVIQGLGNGSAMPNSGFIAMTELFKSRLATNIRTYADPTPTTGTVEAMQATQVTVQIDCFGALSADWAAILSTMLRDDYACKVMAPTAQPLHADDPKMVSMVDGEQQYEQRWMVSAVFQVNPTVSTPMQFFDVAEIGLAEVDTTFPP